MPGAVVSHGQGGAPDQAACVVAGQGAVQTIAFG